jgi:hypothetical protein
MLLIPPRTASQFSGASTAYISMLGSWPVNGHEDHYTVTCRRRNFLIVKISGFDTIVLHGATIKYPGDIYVLIREVGESEPNVSVSQTYVQRVWTSWRNRHLNKDVYGNQRTSMQEPTCMVKLVSLYKNTNPQYSHFGNGVCRNNLSTTWQNDTIH